MDVYKSSMHSKLNFNVELQRQIFISRARKQTMENSFLLFLVSDKLQTSSQTFIYSLLFIQSSYNTPFTHEKCVTMQMLMLFKLQFKAASCKAERQVQIFTRK